MHIHNMGFYEDLKKLSLNYHQIRTLFLLLMMVCQYCTIMHFVEINMLIKTGGLVTLNNKNSAEVDIAPAFGEITTACNVGQAKKGHGACLKSGQLVYARFHTHCHHCCREMYFKSRLDINFLDSMQNIDKVSGA